MDLRNSSATSFSGVLLAFGACVLLASTPSAFACTDLRSPVVKSVTDVGGLPAHAEMPRPALWASASKHDDTTVLLSVINLDLDEHIEARIALDGRRIRKVEARELVAADLHARNSAGNPDNVVPRDASVDARDECLLRRFPPHSVTFLRIDVDA